MLQSHVVRSQEHKTTFQHLVNKVFSEQFGRDVEAYNNDMLIKNSNANNHFVDLEETFQMFERYNMRLNPEKCTFGTTYGKFLGFLITHHGIETNSEKIQTILDITLPRTVKDVQCLMGRIATLNRFMLKVGEK